MLLFLYYGPVQGVLADTRRWPLEENAEEAESDISGYVQKQYIYERTFPPGVSFRRLLIAGTAC